MSRVYRRPEKNHGSCGRRATGELSIRRTGCAKMMSLVSQTLSASGTGAVLIATDVRLRSRHVALQGSGHGKFCTGVDDEVQNCDSSSVCLRERRRTIASEAGGTHGLHAA